MQNSMARQSNVHLATDRDACGIGEPVDLLYTYTYPNSTDSDPSLSVETAVASGDDRLTDRRTPGGSDDRVDVDYALERIGKSSEFSPSAISIKWPAVSDSQSVALFV